MIPRIIKLLLGVLKINSLGMILKGRSQIMIGQRQQQQVGFHINSQQAHQVAKLS